MASYTMLLHLALSIILVTQSTAQTFKCTSNTTTCHGLIDYVSPNTTTITTIQTLFNIKNLRTLLGANDLPLSTSPNYTISAKQKITIPFPCLCTNGTGISNNLPIYTVQKDDGLYHIAAEVFSGLVTYQEIMAVNNITNENKIDIGQKLWIPLPCSCDEVDGVKVVHYGHVVEAGSTVEAIAQRYNTTEDTLLKLNGIANPKDLLAGAVLDVPLKACASVIESNSLDYPLLVSNGTYVFTANNCVTCKCDYANNFTLKCEPSQINATNGTMCPSMQCQGTGSLYIGNSTSDKCNSSTCAYAGYTNQTILTSLLTDTTCPASGAWRVGGNVLSWTLLFISIQFVVLCFDYVL